MRYLSVCSGIEAASVAWAPLGWRAIGFAEIEAFPSRVLAHRYGSNLPDEPPARNGVPNFGDFTTIDTGALGPVDLLVGGTPCQAFSVAGKRLSLADARGNLSLAYAVLAHDLARSHGLRWAVWENVPGVLNTPDNAFGCFLAALVGGDGALEPVARPRAGRSNAFWRWRPAGVELDDEGDEIVVEAGHVTRWPSAGMVAGPLCRAAWRILDAQYFGLAQRRRRVFVVVGFGDGADPAAVLFERQGLRRHPPSRGDAAAGAAVAALTGTSPGDGWRIGADEAAAGQLVVTHALRGEGFDASEDGTGRGTPIVPIAFGGNNTTGPIDVAAALNAHGGPCGRQDFESETFVVAPSLTSNPYGDHVSREGLLVPICFDPRQADVLVHGDKTGPLDTQFPGPAIASGWAVRRLMPVECERLQGFPDGSTDIPDAADGPRYKALGNSMAVPVMAWIGRRLAAVDAGGMP